MFASRRLIVSAPRAISCQARTASPADLSLPTILRGSRVLSTCNGTVALRQLQKTRIS
jgi:hypothetical protein